MKTKALHRKGFLDSHSVLLHSDKKYENFSFEEPFRNVISIEIIDGMINTGNDQWLTIKSRGIESKMQYMANSTLVPLGLTMSNIPIDLKHNPRFFSSPKDTLSNIEISIEPVISGTSLVFTGNWFLQVQITTIRVGTDWAQTGYDQNLPIPMIYDRTKSNDSNDTFTGSSGDTKDTKNIKDIKDTKDTKGPPKSTVVTGVIKGKKSPRTYSSIFQPIAIGSCALAVAGLGVRFK